MVAVDVAERPPVCQQTGCAHRNCDPQSINERWAFCRQWRMRVHECRCCGGPTLGTCGDGLCPTCAPTMDEIISQILAETEI
jgi:hypothetical protein